MLPRITVLTAALFPTRDGEDYFMYLCEINESVRIQNIYGGIFPK